ncbi:hypothetical protein ACQ4M4_01850 [Leptolyngbya sp. AN02str]|uniref:hypothetical protein n=1 Tax=Leptolyngbya sp. AN02str TaxID=3423363 RepID=UPI003D31DEF2
MPPRWPRKPDRNDPAFRKLDDRMNFALHVAVFAATNSGLWFFETVKPGSLMNLGVVSGVWLAALVVHAVYIFAIAKYPVTPYTDKS